jgi:hypothetical protein
VARSGYALAVAVLGACEPPPPTPSDAIVVPYQFNLEFALEQDQALEGTYTARARLYDIAQAYDVLGNAGTIELTGGDAVYADGIELDIETRTVIGPTLRVDYSQDLAAGQDAYVFELRRPDDERIEATIPTPHPFDVAEPGEIAWEDPWADLTWGPVVPGATVDLHIRPLDDGCLTVIGGDVGDVALGLDDTGAYRMDTNVYHSPDHDCTYELILARRFVEAVPGTWHRSGNELPANDVWAIGLHTVRTTFVASQR